MGFFDWLLDKRDDHDQQDPNQELAHWRIAEIRGEGGEVVVARIRLSRPELPNLDQYTTAVSVSWPIDGPHLKPQVSAAMNRFEVSMEELSEFCYLIQVRTGLGERNWLYYTSDGHRLTNEIQSRASMLGLPELTIGSQQDPDWAEWRLLAERIRTTPR